MIKRISCKGIEFDDATKATFSTDAVKDAPAVEAANAKALAGEGMRIFVHRVPALSVDAVAGTVDGIQTRSDGKLPPDKWWVPKSGDLDLVREVDGG